MIVRIKYGAGVEKADKRIEGVREIREYLASICLYGPGVMPRDGKHKKSEIIDMFVEMEGK
jgi:hypothetical protein